MTRSDIRENVWMAFRSGSTNCAHSDDSRRGHRTMTVIVIAAFVSGIDTRVSKEIESFGTNSIYVYRFDPGFNFNPSPGENAEGAEL